MNEFTVLFLFLLFCLIFLYSPGNRKKIFYVTINLNINARLKRGGQTGSRGRCLKKGMAGTPLKALIGLAQRHWSCMPTHWNSYFYSHTYEKTYLPVQFTKGCLFVNMLTEFNAKMLSGCWRYKPGFFFFLASDKNK